MDTNKRYQRVWKLLCRIARPYLEKRFRFTHDTLKPEGPCLIVSNHVTNWDPLLMAICFPETHIHFVASEHLFRMGWKSKIIQYLVAPIPRPKGAKGTATAMDCLRKIREGRSVCIFAEGETTWDGCSQKVFPATATMAKVSGATLITYRLEGGYLTLPRWGSAIRRGGMHGGVVNTYSPEQLKAMSLEEIENAMNADIYEDAWARQKKAPASYPGKTLAEGIEVALFLCPACRQIGRITGKQNTVSCQCGWNTRVTEYGTFDPPVPFENMAQWDQWQHEALHKGEFAHGDKLFSDGEVALKQLLNDHREKIVSRGKLAMDRVALWVGERSFALDEIADMALIQRRRLAFMHNGLYYELQADKPSCFRKYHAVWQQAAQKI